MALARALRFSFIMLVAGVLVAGCSDEPAPATPAQAKPVPKSKQAQLPAPSVEEQLAARVDVPDFYPEDAPLYAGAKASSVGWESGRVSAVFTTADPPSDVSREVQASLRDSGWEDVVVAEMVNGVVVQGGKDERGVSALISLMEQGGDEVTMIMVAVDP